MHFRLVYMDNLRINLVQYLLRCDAYGTDVNFNSLIHVLMSVNITCRSEWPRGLRYELSWPTQTLGSWVRIQLDAWMFVCVYSAFVQPCVQVAALQRADPPSKGFVCVRGGPNQPLHHDPQWSIVQGVYHLCTRIKKLRKQSKSKRGL
jgi:hypothetical protein